MLWGWFVLALSAMVLALLSAWRYGQKKREVYVVLAVVGFFLFVVGLHIALLSVDDLVQQCKSVGAGVECNDPFSVESCYCSGPIGALPLVF
jgi:hypothetical protein